MRKMWMWIGASSLCFAFAANSARALSLSESILHFEETQGRVGLAPAEWRLGQKTSLSSRLLLFVPTRLDPHAWPKYADDYWDDDWMGTLRQTVRLRYAPAEWFILSARRTTSMSAFRRGGYQNEYGPRANRWLRTNLTLGAEVLAGKGTWSFYLPATAQVSRFAHYMEGARHNQEWRSSLWITPEVTYYAAHGVTYSFSYETDTFIASDWSETYLWESLATGTITLRASIPL